MATKLTLRLDEALIRRAKAHARRSGKSVSRMVADFFAVLGPAEPPGEEDLTPKVRSLVGALRGAPGDEADYRGHLERKHR